ncbi:MAG TPA: twin-arginine translocation signal domain-containing protein, partial [Candidatus Sumerlaeota bacterium]|nr:twin-arginine translocation signal domain-containing protein [Candidatus Sumerlaeota bacterium]
MNQLNRRNFLKTGVLASAAGSLLFQGYSSAQAATEDQPVGANDAVRVAVVGFRGQGAGHIDRYLKI